MLRTEAILNFAGSIAKQYGNTSYIKVPYKTAGIARSFLSILANDAVQEIMDSISKTASDTGTIRISLNMDRFTKKGRSDVSRNIIYSPSGGGSKYITDNIVPQAWEMSLEANIPFDGDVGGIMSFLSNQTLGRLTTANASAILMRKRIIRTVLEKAYESGTPIAFKDDSNTVYSKCAIQGIEFIPTAESENHLRIRLTLVEMRTLSSISDAFSSVVADSCTIGKVWGKSSDIGACVASYAGGSLSTLVSSIGVSTGILGAL